MVELKVTQNVLSLTRHTGVLAQDVFSAFKRSTDPGDAGSRVEVFTGPKIRTRTRRDP